MAAAIEICRLAIGYSGNPVLENLDFTIGEKEIFCIMGGSGCGKSTLLKHMIGLYSPLQGDVRIFGKSIVHCSAQERRQLMRSFGVTYQGGALFGWMNVAENVAMPLREYTDLPEPEIQRRVAEKLALVDLAGQGGKMPAELSGGMLKRAGVARAMALDPKLLFLDEPSAGLDPVTSAELDRLILRLRDDYGATVVVVTHELDSVFAVADRAIMLDRRTRGMAALGKPEELRHDCPDDWVRNFLNRGGLRREGAR